MRSVAVRRFLLSLVAVAMGAPLLTSAANDQSTDSLRLPKPDYVDAVERWREGKPAEALDRLDRVVSEGTSTSEQPVPALLLRATLLEESGRWADAEPLWRTVMAREPALATFAAREIVVNLCARRLPAQAVSVASRPPLAERDEAPADLALLIGHAYRATKDEEGAIAQYQRVLSARSIGTVADTARLSLASALEATGDAPGALRTLRDAQLLHTDGRTYLRARAEAARLAAANPTAASSLSPWSPWSPGDYGALTRKLRNGSRFDEAATLYLEWRTLPGANLEAIDAAIVETLYDGRANDEAMSRAAVFLEAYPTSTARARVQLLQFRLDVREGRVDEAQRRGQAFVDEAVPGATAADRRTAVSLLAGYLVAVGRVKQGLDAYRALYALTPQAGDRSLVLWREGVAAIRAGNLTRAEASLRQALTLKPVGDTRPAAQYWLAAIDAQQGRTGAAAANWRQLAASYPLDYYGARSAERLAALPSPVGPASPRVPVGPTSLPAPVGPASPPSPVGPASLPAPVGPASLPAVQKPPSRAPKSKRPTGRGRASATVPVAPRRFAVPTLDVTTANADYTAARLLALAGLAAPAADYARRVLAGRRNSRGVALLAARAAADGSQPHRAMSIAVSYFGSDVARPTPGAPADLASLAYPRAYWEDVRKAADAHRVEPWLLLALARQESLFDANARSEAGAIGMFQLMPATAALVADDAGVTTDEDALLQPAVSARLAARLLRTLLDRYDNALPAVIAAYNAGHERVDLWWQSGRTLSEDLFIDTIPYSETRRYVRAVLRNLKRYREIYGKN